MENLSLKKMAEKLKSGELSSAQLVEHYKTKIENLDPKIVSFSSCQFDEAESEAAKRDHEPFGRLSGIPFAVKDVFNVRGTHTQACSRILKGYKSPYTASVVEKLLAEGAISIGKNNHDEFAMGSRNTYSVCGSAKNPWDLSRSAGGSSGGSAAAVSAGLIPFSLGTDTGGSVRQPAHFCGVVGVKPTYGRASRYGMIAFASSLDQAGVLARSVEDAAMVLENICGFDPKDSTSSIQPVPAWGDKLNRRVKGLKVGILKSENISAEVEVQMTRAKQELAGEGAEIMEIDLPLIEHAVSVYYLIAESEASSNLARYDGVRFGLRSDFSKEPPEDLEEFYSRTRSEGFGPEVKRRLIMGTYFLSSGYQEAFYLKACKVRRKIRDQVLAAFEKCDVILSAVTSGCAPKLDEDEDSPIQQYLDDQLTIPANLCGLPAMSVPVANFKNGMPMGLQVMAAPFEEQKMLDLGAFLEEKSAFDKGVPNGLR